MLKILGRNNSMNVQKVLWGCAEMNIEYERVDIGGAFGGNDKPDYLAMNPNGTVPTLIDGDFIVWESNTVLRYIANAYGDGTIYPRDTKRLAAAEKWMDWHTSLQSPALFPVFWGLIRTPPEKRDMTRIGKKRDELAAIMGRLDQELAKTRFVGGADFTVGDIPVGIGSYRWFNMPIEREDFPNLKRWYDEISVRPGFKTFIDIGLS